MAYTYSKIATYTVGSGGTTDINFINIPQNYTDLKLVLSARASAGTNYYQYPYMYFNSNYSNYVWKDLYADTATPGSQSGSLYYAGYIPDTSTGANIFGSAEYYIPNYSGSNYKSMSYETVTENNSSTNSQWIIDLGCYVWQNTSSITSIGFYLPAARTFAQHTTAHLYGIKNEV